MDRSLPIKVLCAAGLISAAASAAQPCNSLASLPLPNNTTITLAAPVPAGPFTPPDFSRVNVPAFCRVSGVARPTSDSVIKFEVWLPDAWNGRLDQGGNGGYGRGFNREVRPRVRRNQGARRSPPAAWPC